MSKTKKKGSPYKKDAVRARTGKIHPDSTGACDADVGGVSKDTHNVNVGVGVAPHKRAGADLNIGEEEGEDDDDEDEDGEGEEEGDDDDEEEVEGGEEEEDERKIGGLPSIHVSRQ